MIGLKKDKELSKRKIKRVVRKSFLIDPLTGKKIYPKNAEFFQILVDDTKSN